MLVSCEFLSPFAPSNFSANRKYGNVHRQLRSLVILDFLIQNAGDSFLRTFADEPLLERLRVAATDPVSDPAVKEKCKQMFPQWAASYKGTPGMERVAALYKQLPKRKKPMRQQQSKVLKETDNPEGTSAIRHSVSVAAGDGPSTILGSSSKTSDNTPSKRPFSSKKSKEKRRGKPFNLEKEKPELLQTIASASVASTNLMNALKLVNREDQRVSESPEVIDKFELCKNLRRQLLRYIQHVETDEFLGGLIHANDELVNALIAFEVLDKSVDYDSDSEDDFNFNEYGHNSGADGGMSTHFAGLKIEPSKSRPSEISSSRNDLESESEQSEDYDDDDDADNPFGDRNAIRTPAVEKAAPTW